jgi:hypothetical protein
MMAFVNALFPNLKLIHGLERNFNLPTTVVTNGGAEYRLNKLTNYRTTWKWPARLIRAEDRKAMALFYTDTAMGSLYSFKFKDPDLNTWTNTPLVYTGSSNNFFLRSPLDTHPIFNLDADVAIKSGSTVVAHSVVVVNGVPCAHVAGYTSGLTISGTFYFSARFDQGQLNWVMSALASDNTSLGDDIGDISLIEVFE